MIEMCLLREGVGCRSSYRDTSRSCKCSLGASTWLLLETYWYLPVDISVSTQSPIRLNPSEREFGPVGLPSLIGRQLIGPTRTNETNGEAPGGAGDRMLAGAVVPQDGAQTNQLEEGADGWRCAVGNCTMSFASKRGLGQHMRLSHPVEHNSGIDVERVKARWRQEECKLLAKAEVEAVKAGRLHINKHLVTVFPHRTLESIKKRRQHPEHKGFVNEYMNAVEEEVEPGNVDMGHSDEIRDALISEIRAIIATFENPRPSLRRLIEIAEEVLSGNSSNGRISGWLMRSFPHARMPRGVQQRRPIDVTANRRKRRRQQYWYMQKLFKKDAAAAAREVLRDPGETVEMPPSDDVVNFWRSVYERGAAAVPEEEADNGWAVNNALNSLWSPISDADIRTSELGIDSAAGPDGVSVANWSSIPIPQRRLVYCVIMLEGSMETELSRARTVLIPKTTGLLGPGDFRPLSITSVVTRQFHKILARRLKGLHNFSETQRAFTDCDGTVENLSILSAILADARISRKEVHIASLDIKKAFDSVAHAVIIDTIKKMGCPREFVNYVAKLYANAKTILQWAGVNTEIQMEEGVLQGDPLSPLLFNAVVDIALKAIDKAVGYTLHGKLVSSIAYADDILLVSSTKIGMMKILAAFARTMATFGLHINFDKSNIISLVPSGKEKKVKVLSEQTFSIDDHPIKQVGIIDGWKYLGIQFEGHTIAGKRVSMHDDLLKLDKAPLKPQQRLHMLKTNVIPKFLHVLVLGKTTKGRLEALDRNNRAFVRKWLKLPKDVPIAYFHACVRSGGLGITCLAESVPLTRKERLTKFLETGSPTAQAMSESYYIKGLLERCNKQLAHIGENVDKSMRKAVWDDKLEAKFDTKHLTVSKESKASTSWVEKRANAIKAHDYIHYHQVRAGCLPSRTRTSRGRNYDAMCRAGCRLPETNYHVIQQCHRTHGGRILRHDRIVDIVAERLGSMAEYDVIVEPRFRTPIGLRKPDLLVTKAGTTWVLDAQVVSGTNMRRDHAEKRSVYNGVPGLEAQIKERCTADIVKYEAITISYKGIFSKESDDLLTKLGLNEYDMFKIVTSTLRGTWLNWTRFNQINTINPLPPRRVP